MQMRKLNLSIYALLLLLLASCGKKQQDGQLVGAQDRPKWGGINPYGMVYVPSGTLHIGTGDEDLSKQLVSRPKSRAESEILESTNPAAVRSGHGYQFL